jgi:hypothetical protein
MKNLLMRYTVSLSTLLSIAACDNSYKTIPYTEINGLNKRGEPFIREYNKGKRAVLVFGSYHTMDPNDREVKEIISSLEKFRPDVILYEGDNIGFKESIESSVAEFFEMGLARWWANSQRIEDMNIEPPPEKKYQYLLKNYPKNEVLLTTILSQNILFIVNHTKKDFEREYPVWIRGLKEQGFPLGIKEQSLDYFYEKYKGFYGKEFDPVTFDYKTVELKYNKTKLNRVNQDAAWFRDQYMLAQIENSLKMHKRVYVQVGVFHALSWQPGVEQIID